MMNRGEKERGHIEEQVWVWVCAIIIVLIVIS